MPLVLHDLVKAVAKATRLRNHEARVVVQRILGEMVEALGRGERVELRGLGSFEAPLWKGRKGRDWKSGRTVDLPPLRRLIFRPGRSLRPRKIPEKTADPSGQYWMFEEDGKPADKKP